MPLRARSTGRQNPPDDDAGIHGGMLTERLAGVAILLLILPNTVTAVEVCCRLDPLSAATFYHSVPCIRRPPQHALFPRVASPTRDM